MTKMVGLAKRLRAEGIDHRSLSMIHMTIIRDYFQSMSKMPTHVEGDVLRSLFIQRLKLPFDSDLL